jgi:hypothetical protein
MALSPPEGPSQQSAQQRDLPATYRNPWSTLGDNLWAVVADTRLRVQEVVRRNGQGSLWRPSWWPADLAPLFWPLLLALGLTLVVLLGLQGASALRRLTPPVSPAIRSAAIEAGPAEAPEADEPPPEPLALEPPLMPEAPPAPSPDGVGELAEEPPDLPLAEVPAEPQPPDPLDALVQRSDADGLLLQAVASADQRTLVLQVAPAFAALSVAAQQRYAEQWQLWAADLGYDHLELRDSRSGLLARDALVGAGMIVLNESSSP